MGSNTYGIFSVYYIKNINFLSLLRKIFTSCLFLAIFFTFIMPHTFARQLSVADAVNLALKQNLDLKMATEREKIAKFTIDATKGEHGFSIIISNELDFSKSDNYLKRSSNNLTLSATYPLYSGGKDMVAITRAKINLHSQKLLRQREAEKVKFFVIKAYYDALEAKNNVKIHRASVKNYREHLELVNNLFLAGTRAKVDVLRSSVALKNAENECIQAENNAKIAMSTLKNLLFLSEEEDLLLTDKFTDESFAPSLEQCVTYALKSRIDLQKIQDDINDKQLLIKGEEANKKVHISFHAGVNHSNTFSPAKNADNSYSVGLRANWQIFDQGITKAKIEIAKASLKNAVFAQQNEEHSVLLALRKAYYHLFEAQERMHTLKSALLEAEENFYIAREKYKVGAGILLDIVDAELALSKAKRNNLTAMYDCARYKAELIYELGIPLDVAEREEIERISHL